MFPANTTMIVFPGQGSQQPGMGKALAENFAAAREVLQEVDDALGQSLSRLMFEGPEADLQLTANAQPAIMAASIAMLLVLEQQCGFKVPERAAFVAGHSLGEYSALCAAGVLSLADTARLLQRRGRAMQAAVPVGLGGMAALIGADFAVAEAIAQEAAQGEVCVAANDNAPGQVVLSGHMAAIDRAVALAQAKGIKRAIKLNVSAPFHCSLMQTAADAMATALAATNFSAPSVPVVTNVTAAAVRNPDELRELLVAQVTGAVRWRESMEWAAAQGIVQLLELGHGQVLSGLAKRINPNLKSLALGAPADIEQLMKATAA